MDDIIGKILIITFTIAMLLTGLIVGLSYDNNIDIDFIKDCPDNNLVNVEVLEPEECNPEIIYEYFTDTVVLQDECMDLEEKCIGFENELAEVGTENEALKTEMHKVQNEVDKYKSLFYELRDKYQSDIYTKCMEDKSYCKFLEQTK